VVSFASALALAFAAVSIHELHGLKAVAIQFLAWEPGFLLMFPIHFAFAFPSPSP